jgi:hypothetical protein
MPRFQIFCDGYWNMWIHFRILLRHRLMRYCQYVVITVLIIYDVDVVDANFDADVSLCVSFSLLFCVVSVFLFHFEAHSIYIL